MKRAHTTPPQPSVATPAIPDRTPRNSYYAAEQNPLPGEWHHDYLPSQPGPVEPPRFGRR
jgi:hypothetical protein